MSVLLSSVVGGGGGGLSIKKINVWQQIAVGSSGTLLTVPAGPGERVKLVSLASNNNQINISVAFGGVDIVTAKTLTAIGTADLDYFVIGDLSGSTNPNPYDRPAFTPSVIGGVGENLTVSITTGSTTRTIRYSTQILK